MLIKIFGIWLMATNINALWDKGGDCHIEMNATNHWRRVIEDTPCSDVAAEINRQIREQK